MTSYATNPRDPVGLPWPQREGARGVATIGIEAIFAGVFGILAASAAFGEYKSRANIWYLTVQLALEPSR